MNKKKLLNKIEFNLKHKETKKRNIIFQVKIHNEDNSVKKIYEQHGATFIKQKPNDTKKRYADKQQTDLSYLSSYSPRQMKQIKIPKTSNQDRAMLK